MEITSWSQESLISHHVLIPVATAEVIDRRCDSWSQENSISHRVLVPVATAEAKTKSGATSFVIVRVCLLINSVHKNKKILAAVVPRVILMVLQSRQHLPVLQNRHHFECSIMFP